MDPRLYVVHCVDTEGPLLETAEATFERLHNVKGIDLPASADTLRLLQAGEIDLNGREAEIADFLSPRRLGYRESWPEIEEMVSEITSEAYRMDRCDSLGRPYAFTWMIIDVVGYRDNPRQKSTGFHAIWDRYLEILSGRAFNDGFGWHFHTVAPGGHALDYNTSWTNNDWHEQSLARRIIERGWFPSVFRAGCLIERNDLSYWLEQFVPFDYSCRSLADAGGAPGSLRDWRGAPAEWGYYHPDFYDYRRKGDMRRRIFRCLDVDSFDTQLTEPEVEAAFQKVERGETTVLAYSNHDRRDMRPDIDNAMQMIREAATRHPDVVWEFADAARAARLCAGLKETTAPRFEIDVQGRDVSIRSSQPLFGPAPFLAVEESGEVFFRDNPTRESDTEWAYRIPRPDNTLAIGVGGSDASGATGTQVIRFDAEAEKRTVKAR